MLHSSPGGKRNFHVFEVIEILFQKLTQGGRLIAFLLVIPHNIKFRFQAELNLETLHSSTLWGWKDLFNEQLVFKNDPNDVEEMNHIKIEYSSSLEMQRRLFLSLLFMACTYSILCDSFLLTWRKGYGTFVAHL